MSDLVQMLIECVRRQLEARIHDLWIPRVGDRIEFVGDVETHHWKYDPYNPQVGDKGVIVSQYKNYWNYDGYIIALDNGFQVDYEFPRKRYMRLLHARRQRKAAV